MRSRGRFFENVIAVALAFAMSLAIILIVEKYLVNEISGDSEQQAVLFLEVAIILVAIGSFLLREILHTIGTILNMVRGKSSDTEMPTKGIFIMLLALVVSALIYFSLVRWAAVGPRQEAMVSVAAIVGS